MPILDCYLIFLIWLPFGRKKYVYNDKKNVENLKY